MRNKRQNPNDFFWFSLILFALLVIFVPWIINSSLMNWNISTAEGLGNKEWLGFWGTYIGSALGVIVTILAFMLTFKQNQKQNIDIQEQNKIVQEQNKIIQEQNDISRKLAEEQMRLQSLPFINVYFQRDESLPILKEKMFDPNGNIIDTRIEPSIGLHFEFENIGVGPAIGVKISNQFSLGHFSVGEKKCYRFYLPFEIVKMIPIQVVYTDRENREYVQESEFSAYNDKYEVNIDSPKFNQ